MTSLTVDFGPWHYRARPQFFPMGLCQGWDLLAPDQSRAPFSTVVTGVLTSVLTIWSDLHQYGSQRAFHVCDNCAESVARPVFSRASSGWSTWRRSNPRPHAAQLCLIKGPAAYTGRYQCYNARRRQHSWCVKLGHILLASHLRAKGWLPKFGLGISIARRLVPGVKHEVLSAGRTRNRVYP